MKYARTPILAKYEWLGDYHERTLRERYRARAVYVVLDEWFKFRY